MKLEDIFAKKLTENGDTAYNTTMNHLLDLLFMSEYYSKHLDEAYIGTSEKEKLFSMFMRDPRFGMGRRDFGRRLMLMAGVTPTDVVTAGRFDDLFTEWEHMSEKDFATMCDYLKTEILNGNELCKKWMPRYSSKNLMLARKIAKQFGLNKQQYGHFIKCNTTENKLSRHNVDDINFSQVPSLAMVKYFNRFATKEDTKERFQRYLSDVQNGKADLKISTTTVYDIYKNRNMIDPDLFFSKIEKISGSWIPVVDTSGSMYDSTDSIGKALSIGHYLAKCSTYAPDTVLSFSSRPSLLKLGIPNTYTVGRYDWDYEATYKVQKLDNSSKYMQEISSMKTGDMSNTDFGAVCKKLKELDAENAPEWIIVLSDMEWDCGSRNNAKETMELFRENNFKTNIIWWNLNDRNKTVPFKADEFNNIYLSGYNPVLLKFLEVSFNGEKFLDKLLYEYQNKINN